MTQINSKVDICNMALGFLGNYGTIENIDTPIDDKEITMAQWYDVTRKFVLKKMCASFSLDRMYVAQLADAPAFGYAKAYQRPVGVIKVLGIGNLDIRDNEYSIESGKILTNEDYSNGMPIRVVLDIEDVNKMSSEFTICLAMQLAVFTALQVTQDAAKVKLVRELLIPEIAGACGMDAQENRPIRINRSNFAASRVNGVGYQNGKK